MASSKIERDMYGGEVHLSHNPNARGRTPRYVATFGDGTVLTPQGVTTILGKTLAKDFVQWATDAALDYLRTKLPAVTEEDLIEAGKEHIRLRDAGAGFGTEAHAMVEDYLKGRPPGTTQHSEEAMNAFGAFIDWFEKTKPKVLNVEEVVYSRKFGYSGTYDCMLEIGGKVYLCDLKTTNTSRKAPNGVYAENFIQLGGYANAHQEQSEVDNLPKIDGLMVISAKKDGKLDIVTNEDVGLSLYRCQKSFEIVVALNNFMQTTTVKLGGK